MFEELKGWRGWTKRWLPRAKKWHYFNESYQSLCGKWELEGTVTLVDSDDDSLDNCAVCRRRVAKLRETWRAEEEAHRQRR
jgi:hypothetical protein